MFYYHAQEGVLVPPVYGFLSHEKQSLMKQRMRKIEWGMDLFITVINKSMQGDGFMQEHTFTYRMIRHLLARKNCSELKYYLLLH